MQKLAGIRPGKAANRLECTEPEHLANNRRVLQEPLLDVGEQIQSRGDDAVNGLRYLRELAVFEQDSTELLGVQRVAPDAGQQRIVRHRTKHRPLQECSHKSRGVGLRQRSKRYRQGVDFATRRTGPPIEQPRPDAQVRQPVCRSVCQLRVERPRPRAHTQRITPQTGGRPK